MLLKLQLRKLKGRIIEKYGSTQEFATALGITRQSVYNKLCGYTDFSKKSIIEWCEALEIDEADIISYFF